MAVTDPHRPPTRPCQRGQAAVETVGIIVAIAILLAASAAVLSGGFSLTRPPDLVGAIARVLGGGGSDEPRPGLDVPGPGGYVRADHGVIAPSGDEPIGRLLGSAGGAVAGAAEESRFLLEIQAAFYDGLQDRADERIAQIRRDPLGFVWGMRDALLDHEAGMRQLSDTVSRLSGYVGELVRMTAKDAVLRVSHDLGGEAFDEGASLAVRGALRGVSRRVGRGSAPQGEAPDGRGLEGHGVMR